MSPTVEGLVNGEFVDVIKAAAGWHALSETGEAYAGRAEEIGDVVCGGFAFDVRAEGEDDFFGLEIPDAVD